MGSQLLIGYKLRHFSNPLFITNLVLLSSGNCFLKPPGKRNLPFASNVASYSPKKPILYKGLSLTKHLLPQNNTFSHSLRKFIFVIFFHLL